MRRKLYRIRTTIAEVFWLAGMGCFRVAYKHAVAGGRMYPDQDPESCHIATAREFDRRHRAWVAAGSDKNDMPYVVCRLSQVEPVWVWHSFVGKRDRETGVMELESFKPVDPQPGTIWQRFRFKGRVVRGD